MLYRDVIEIQTEPQKFYDITQHVSAIVAKSKVKDGLCHVFIQHTTAALWLNENDRLLLEDIRRLLEAMAPEKKIYQHPDNAYSHLRASLLRAECTLPVANGSLALGTWQSLMLWEFDTDKRTRKIVVTVSG